ncbi:hypothetical protein RYX36_008507 [Vicia faba]
MKKHKKRSLDTKCSEGGQLLACEVVTGPLLVPESCIGMTTNIYPKHTSGVDPCHNKYIDETNDIVQCKAPFRYFCDKAVDNKDFPEFKQDWLKMKEEYEQLNS